MPLRELTVENLAVVESVRLALEPGFTVLTGETGAGKSLVVDALALALGERASSDLVRAGTDAARVEAIFDAPAVDPDHALADVVDAGEGLLIVRREIGSDGRSSVRVNDRAVTVGGLASLGEALGEIHGQHEQQRLLGLGHQLRLLDAFGGHAALVGGVREAFDAWRAAVAASAELLTDDHELARRVDLLRHQTAEISAAAPRQGEDEELEAQLRAAAHAETIARSTAEAVAALRDEGGATDALGAAERGLWAASQHDERLADLAGRAAALAAESAELARDVAAASEAVELDPASRAAAEERLALLYDLRRKYGDVLDAVIAFGQDAAAELHRLEHQGEERERSRALEAERMEALTASCDRLRAARLAAAGRLAKAVNAELPPLGLPAGAFDVELSPVEPGASGADRVTFTFAPNPGEPPRPLGRIASGGEASRLALALKVVLAGGDETPLLVFDEVDAGVGGRNASALGERLKVLSAYHQVICVTHLPQVAAHADAHLVVDKRVAGRRTTTVVRVLDTHERAVELAAMLGGPAGGEEAHAAAAALLRSASE
ncbi:MAG TPA: DNA repair protein RecN [Candidatus Limnocylindria bacterium]|nr:DNA repair protein RecN [Candidatus Limnocylindria bacterium]